MEEDGEEETPRSPFWIQTTTNVSRIQRYRRRISSLFFNSFVLIIFLLLFALLSMVFIIPSAIQFSYHNFKPNLVKRSWDSINLLLVLIALAFGFLGRNINNDDKLSFDDGSQSELISGGRPLTPPSTSTPRQWYGFPDQPMNSAIGLRRQRTSSSYPDLRELSPPWNHRAVDPWRFSDDTHLDYYRVLESNRNYLRQRSRQEHNSDTQEEVLVNAYGGLPQETLYTPAPLPEEGLYFPSPQPPSLPPQPPAHTVTVKKKTNRIFHNVAVEDGEGSSSSGSGKILSPETESSEHKGGRGERKSGDSDRRRARSNEPRNILSPVIDPLPEPSSPPPVSPLTERKRNGGNGTKEFFTSFYHKKKKKKRQRERSVDNLENLLNHSQPPAIRFQQPPAPPPPPPSPPSVLHNLFPSKKEKKKKIISIAPAPPAPPPPPPRTASLAPRPTTTRVAPFLTDKPRVPFPMSSFNGIDDSSSGGDSPMKQLPPPPPLPPFKMPDWKFAVEGDFVRLQSTLSSRSVSPDGDESQSPSSDVEASALAPPLLCPSPDVDTKADSFIARFRAGLKLEKINSLNQNQGIRMSKLGPGPNDC